MTTAPDLRILTPWLLALLATLAAACHRRGPQRLPTSKLATVDIKELGEPGYDSFKVRVYRPDDREDPVYDQRLPRGQGQVGLKLAPGRYSFQLDYLQGAQVTMSSMACPDATEFELKPGPNPLTIYVCDAEGRRFPPEAAECTAGKPAYGKRALRLLTRQEYQRTVERLTGFKGDVVADFPKEVRHHGLENHAEMMVVTDAHADAYLKAAARIAPEVVKDLDRHVRCESGLGDEACAERFIRAFGKRAFRGPVTDAEASRLLAVFREGWASQPSRKAGIELVVQAMLMSPRFLYRFELGQPEGDHYALDPWEIAQALSYTYWGTMPDERLFGLAENGTLRQPAVIAAEARRLLDDAQSREMIGRFAASWLGADQVLAVNKDTAAYPEFTSGLREKLLSETKGFFTRAVFDANADFSHLFTATHTFGDDELARLYGGQLQNGRIALPAAERAGLLGHASIQAAYADADATSPIRRGLFVLERLLCQEVPPPPSTLDVKPPPRDPQATTRERFAAHTKDAACAVCHKRIDGAGFGLEDMDPIGRFRAQQAGKPVDSSGRLVGVDGVAEQPFNGTAQLSQLIAQSKEARLCYVKQVRRFTSGQREDKGDGCAVTQLYEDFAAGSYNLKQLFLAIPSQEAFLNRRD